MKTTTTVLAICSVISVCACSGGTASNASAAPSTPPPASGAESTPAASPSATATSPEAAATAPGAAAAQASAPAVPPTAANASVNQPRTNHLRGRFGNRALEIRSALVYSADHPTARQLILFDRARTCENGIGNLPNGTVRLQLVIRPWQAGESHAASPPSADGPHNSQLWGGATTITLDAAPTTAGQPAHGWIHMAPSDQVEANESISLDGDIDVTICGT